MQRYGAVLPEDFERPISSVAGHADTYGSTFVPVDNTFQHVANASFLIWDLDRAVGVLGAQPRVEVHFSVDNLPHEGPVYEPNLDVLFFSRLRPDPPSQYVVDLGVEPPTLSRRTFDPPVVVPCGATYHDGLVYFCGSAMRSGKYVPGVYALNATTGNVWPIVNNYFGYNFGTCDDLAVAPNGNIWFTDNWYSFSLPELRDNNTIPLEAAVYRHRPSTGETQLVSDAFVQPNGIAFSPDGSTVYITDSEADTITNDDRRIRYVSHLRRTVYAADLMASGMGMTNLRAIFMAQDRVPDGIKVARNGYLVTATGHGVDVLDADGVPILRVQTSFTVLNIVWAGKGGTDLWMVGYEKVGRVKWALEGNPIV
ncbi:SMP-30/Gluconolaconase/LRE-like region [Seiridium cupressi]